MAKDAPVQTKSKPETAPTPIQSPPKQQSNLYLVTFRGQYLNGNTDAGRSGFVNYETTVKMTEQMVEFNAQSIFAAVLAPVVMPQRYDDFRHLSTFHVVKTVREDGKQISNIKLLCRAELEDLVRREKLPVNLAVYKDDEDLRQAILLCGSDKVKFLKLQKLQAPKLIERDKYVSEALSLNAPELTDPKNDVSRTINSQPSLQDVLETKRALDKKAKEQKAIDKTLDPYDTPDVNKADNEYKGGQALMKDVLDQDEFPDGRHQVDGENVDVGF